MAPLEGKTANTPRLDSVSTSRQRIAELARQASDMVFTSLAHHIDRDMLHAAYVVTRKDGAVGLDGQRADEYAANMSRLPCAASTSRKGMAGRLDQSGYRRSRTRCCSEPW